MNKHEKLKKSILSRSTESEKFLTACGEWELIGIRTNGKGKCVCGKSIKNIFTIQHTIFLYTLHVGCVHVKFFDDIDPKALVNGINRIKKEITARPNLALIKYARKAGILRKTKEGKEEEYEFLLSVRRKRKFTEKQLSWLKDINRRILSSVAVEQTN